jgi:hypothetical protein
MTPTWRPRYYRPTPLEIASGYILGPVDDGAAIAPDPPETPPDRAPRQVLEQILEEALHSPPCVVQFSGGRDSSLLLAVATAVARREGLPAPIACSFRYEGEPSTDESSWQELVIRHLGVEHWERLSVGERYDMVGDLAQQFLLEHGLVFPATMYNNTLPMALARGGSLISGEGGDEILGYRRSRIVRKLLHDPRLILHRQEAKEAALHLGPRPLRKAAWRHVIRRLVYTDQHMYLRPEVVEHMLDLLSSDLTSEPFMHSASLSWHLRQRAVVKYQEARAAFAAEHGSRHFDPLLEPRFVASYARAVRPLGLLTRTEAMKLLVGDLLPDAVLGRTSKALFNRGFLTNVSRDFAMSWTGRGVDTDLVDPEILRAAWLSDWPPAQSFLLLQAAWLEEHRSQARLRHPAPLATEGPPA